MKLTFPEKAFAIRKHCESGQEIVLIDERELSYTLGLSGEGREIAEYVLLRHGRKIRHSAPEDTTVWEEKK